MCALATHNILHCLTLCSKFCVVAVPVSQAPAHAIHRHSGTYALLQDRPILHVTATHHQLDALSHASTCHLGCHARCHFVSTDSRFFKLRNAVAAASQDGPAEVPDQASLPGALTRVRHVQRRPDIEAVRVELPITGMEQEMMESVLQNDVVVLCGETGCGKTTQVGCHNYPRTVSSAITLMHTLLPLVAPHPTTLPLMSSPT